MTTSRTPTAQELAQRAALFRLLAELYRKELTPALSARLLDSGMLDSLEDLGYDLERNALAEPGEVEALGLEYSRVFIGPGRHVSPYGSVHHPDDPKRGQLWGDTTCSVQRFASDHGLAFEGAAYDGIPDHIAHELELFARLIEGRAQARSRGDREAEERIRNSEGYLVREHLDRWAPRFCAEVREAAARPFYGELARLTATLLADEAAILGKATA